MKVVTCKFSDDFVAQVIEVGRILGEPADFGHIIEHYGGFTFEALTTDPDSILDELTNRTWDTAEEAQGVATRAAEKFPTLGASEVRPSSVSPGRWEIAFSPAPARKEALCC